ncbi:MAG: hypothetical protein H6825_08390 [Planctomycetes bacterium]|nr:hypothetical protein [Planctomycetota bacterium]
MRRARRSRRSALLLLSLVATSLALRAQDAPDTYAQQIAPLLESRCGACHGPAKHKARLALHTPDAIRAGGESGAVLVPGDPDASELLRRVELPADDDDHMPPRGKPQPEPSERALLRAWIAAGASFGDAAGTPHDVSADTRGTDPRAPAGDGTRAAPAAPIVPDPTAVAHLREELVHVETDDPSTGLLWVSCVSRPDVDGAILAGWLAPLRDAVVELSLAGTRVDDASLASLAAMPRLVRLDLARTRITSRGLPALARAPSLRVLVLTGTPLDGTAVASLAALPRLERVSLWGTGLSDDDLQRLRALRPALVVHDGRDETEAPLHTEDEIVLGAPADATSLVSAESAETARHDGQAASAEALAAAAEAALRPSNTRCPVSGDPVDPRFVIVFEGRALGFCCKDCPARFWADPSAFPGRD